MTLDQALWLLVLLLSLRAAWLMRPAFPELDWERLFKTQVATLLRGQLEEEGQQFKDWQEQLRGLLVYHPGGRDLSLKVSEPDAYTPELPSQPGERELLKSLSELSGPSERLSWLCGPEAERSQDSLLEDPDWLGPEYSPASLHPDLSWQDVLRPSTTLQEALGLRLKGILWMVAGARAEAWAQALTELPLDQVVSLPPDPQAWLETIEGELAEASQRLVFLLEGEAVQAGLELMLELPGLRDRVRAVVAIAPEFPRGEPWLVEHFRHHLLDTELARRTAWIALQWVAGDTEQGRRILGTPLPSPPPDPQEREGVELLDLGLVHEPSPAALSLLSSALMLTVTQWLSLRS